MFCYIHDPDHTMIELVYHHRRQFPPPTDYNPAEKARADASESAEQARADPPTSPSPFTGASR